MVIQSKIFIYLLFDLFILFILLLPPNGALKHIISPYLAESKIRSDMTEILLSGHETTIQTNKCIMTVVRYLFNSKQ